jgi:hypothetical protein
MQLLARTGLCGKLWVRVIVTCVNTHQSPTKLTVPSLDAKNTVCDKISKNMLDLKHKEMLQKRNSLHW